MVSEGIGRDGRVIALATASRDPVKPLERV